MSNSRYELDVVRRGDRPFGLPRCRLSVFTTEIDGHLGIRTASQAAGRLNHVKLGLLVLTEAP